MIAITFGQGKDYNLPSEWKEVSLSQAQKVTKAIAEAPEKWLEAQKLRLSGEEKEALELEATLTAEDIEKDIPIMFGSLIEALSDIPKDIIKKLNKPERQRLFELMQNIILGIGLFPYDYEQTGMQSFKFKGKEYFLPTSKRLLEKEIPMAETTAVEFAEASDLQLTAAKVKGGEFDMMPLMIAILCRPRNRKYDQDEAVKTAELFKELPMNYVWEVFFCLRERSSLLKTLEAKFLKVQAESIEAKESRVSMVGMAQ